MFFARLLLLSLVLLLSSGNNVFIFAANPLTTLGAGAPSGGAPPPSYTGPGDIVSGAAYAGSLYAYTAAIAATGTQNSVRVRRASDNTETDVVILTTGYLDTASALTFAGTDASGAGAITGTTLTFTGGHVGDTITGTGVTAGTYIVSGSSPTWTVNFSQTVASTTLTLTWGLYVTKIYDQSGNSRDAVQTTAGNQPQLMLNGGGSSGSQAYILFAGNQYLLTSGTMGFSSSPTFSQGILAVRTGAFTSIGMITCADGFEQFRFQDSANTLFFNGGGSLTATASDSSWHYLQPIFVGGGTSNISVDDSDNTGSAGGGNAFNAVYIGQFAGGGPYYMTGNLTEVILWSGATSSGNRTSLNSNAHSRGGF